MKSSRRSAALLVLVAAVLAVGWSAAAETVTYPFFGVQHIARTEAVPRPLRMHIVEIDLAASGLRFLVTPQTGPRDTQIRTTRQFLSEQGAQIAINAHFFAPFPDDGTGTTWLIGLGASSATSGPHGHAYAPFDRNQGYPYQNDLPALNIASDNTAAVVYQALGDVTGYVTDPPVAFYNAVCGNEQILTHGANTAGTGSWDNTLNPRTAIGVAPGNKLVLFTVDGRQAGVSEGMTTGEVASLLFSDYGVTDAINLDGGGSTTLVMADPAPRIVNVPVGVNNVPGSERSVGSNLGVFARACSTATEGVSCGDDGDPCNGEHVCRSGACVTDTGVTALELVPLAGGTASGLYRARDIADNDYAARFYTAPGAPDYAASDYSGARISVTFQRTGRFLEGSLDARGLKPNFAYQIKLVGMPSAEFGAAGDDVSNERIGYAGRWYRVGVGNASDAQYRACRADPQCRDVYEGYLVFDFFITDRLGSATHHFVADDSFHVLWRDCPSAHPMTGCQAPGARPTVYQDVVALAATGYGYDRDSTTWNIGVFGEVERTAPQSYLSDGEYRSRFVLTEESFHESGIGGNWASVVGEAGLHFWINQTAGARDCSDWNVCNGYESCDGNGACGAGIGDACDDQNMCTDDACDARSGCSHASNAAACSDGDACTADDTCSAGVCASGAASCAVGGTVLYYRDSAGAEPSAKPVPNVGIDRTDDSAADATTDGAGAYSLGALRGDVTVRTLPKFGSPRASDHNGAVTSYDAALIARSAVGLIEFTAGQRMAGDVTGNGEITAYDAAHVAQFAVEIIDHFPVAAADGSDWKFLRCDGYPSCGEAIYGHAPLDGPATDDFHAILYGDVSGNWVGNPLLGGVGAVQGPEQEAAARDRTSAAKPGDVVPRLRRSGAARLSLAGWPASAQPGKRYRVTVSIQNADGILGLDLELLYDRAELSILDVEPIGLAAMYSFSGNDVGGRYTGALYGTTALRGSGEILALTFETRTRAAHPPLRIRAQANEGEIPVSVRGTGPARGSSGGHAP